MSYRQSNPSSKDGCLIPQSRLNQQIRCDSTDEGCPVIEESGTVCGETNSLNIFQEFRQMYDDCLKKLEGTVNGNATLKKLAPFKKLIDDLWEQNTLLVETVEELEQEATYRVTNLQDRLNKSCQKISDYKDDIKSLVKIINSFCENGIFDPTGLKFKTFCCSSVFGNCGDKFCASEVTFKNPSTCSKYTSQTNSTGQQERAEEQCEGYESLGTISSRRTISGRFPSEKSRAFSPVDTIPSYCETSYPDISIRSFDHTRTYDADLGGESTYQDCGHPPININFSIANDEGCDCYECGCTCPTSEE